MHLFVTRLFRRTLFQHERIRARYHPAELLMDPFRRCFTCDGYQAYYSLPERVTVTGCMAHVRRKLDEALTVLKKYFTGETTAYQTMAHQIRMLYKIEEMIRDKTLE